MSKLKQMLKQATIGEHFKNLSGIWTTYINLPDHRAAIQIHQSELLEAKKMRHIIMGALHKYGKEEDYREVPQVMPHEAERKLWKAQREAGTNEQWQHRFEGYSDYFDIPVGQEPGWCPKSFYRVKLKPAKLTAKIICKANIAYQSFAQDWEFFGTPDEYRAECEKYGYVVVSNIEEVKPKTAKYYFCMVDSLVSFISIKGETKEDFKDRLVRSRHNIVGNIEEREVEI